MCVRFCGVVPSLSQTFLIPAHYLSNPPDVTMENGQPTNGSQSSEISLSRILDDETIEHLEHNKSLDAPAVGWDEEAAEKQLEDGYCVECEGMLASPGRSDTPKLTCHPTTQTSRRRCIVNLARTISVMFASRRNIAKALGNSIRLTR